MLLKADLSMVELEDDTQMSFQALLLIIIKFKDDRRLTMKKDFKTDIKNGIYKNDDTIATLIPYIYEGVEYSLQINAPALLRTYMAAAILKYKEGSDFEEILETMDTERFSDENSYSQHEMVRAVIVDCAVRNSKLIGEYLKNSKIQENNKYLFFIALGRLSTSFKAATLLLNNGFFVEVVSILRLIIEQLAWGSFLLEEEDEEKILKNRTQSNVGYLKTQLGENYGILYGYLSSEAHLEPKEIGKYLQLDDKNQVAVRDRSGKECEKETNTLLLLLDGYCELIWKGMNHFGILEEEKVYYTENYHLNKLMVQKMKSKLDKKNVNFKKS